MEHLLALLEGDVIGDEGHLVLHLDAGVPGPSQHHPALALLQHHGPHVGHGSPVGHVGKADNGIQLGYHIVHGLHGLCITCVHTGDGRSVPLAVLLLLLRRYLEAYTESSKLIHLQ